tara:strand:+ start:212 stop:2197 length:1986 start_codon:yes stop_codon:yes gene_type:complete
MSLRIRRGTDAERSGVTFLEGELVYTTDTKKMFVGDGTTVGGIAVDSTQGSINQMSDVNIAGIQVGQILQWDGSNFIPGDDQGDKESVTGADSTILVDATNSSINLDGTVKGHIVPDQNEVYDLGSTTKRFNDLYLSGTTINLGGATITATGGEISMNQPLAVEVKSSGNVDTNDNTITNTAAGGHITVAPTAGKQFRVDDTVGGTSFSVDTTAKSVDIHNGYGLKLATFGSSDYTAIAGSEQAGQIVFDNPTKTLKVYNGSSWVQVTGSGGSGGVVDGQTYDINISGDVISDDSTVALNTASKDLNLITGSFSGTLAAGTLNATNINGLMKGNILHADNAVFLDNSTKTVTATNADFSYVRADILDGNIIGPDSVIMINTSNRSMNVGSVTATTLDVNGSAFADDITITTNAYAVNFVASGQLQGNVEGNVKGDVKATGGQVVLDSGTDGTDATFTGNVNGTLTGTVDSGSDINGTITTSQPAEFENTVDFGKNTQANNRVQYYSLSTNGSFSDTVVNIQNIHDDATYCNELGLYRARGTVAAQTTVQVGDLLGTLSWAGNDGTSPQIALGIKGKVTAVSSSNITADMLFMTRLGGIGTFNESMKLEGATRGLITQSFVQFGSLTSTERDALTAANGMVIYNTTINKFQGYENGAWANLI